MIETSAEKPENLIPEQRRTLIFNLIQRSGSVSVQELADLIGASVSTIRRDLDVLASRGSVARTHGGAILTLSQRTTFEPDYKYASPMFKEEKSAIGKAAADCIRQGQSVIFDSSSTVFHAACHARDQHCSITALTNDINIAAAMVNAPPIELKVIGGTVRPGSFTLLGEPGMSFLGGLHVDVCFLGIQAIQLYSAPAAAAPLSCGALSDTSLEVAAMKRRMVQAARRTFVLADSSKFGPPAFCDVCDFSQIDAIITDRGIDSGKQAILKKSGLEVIVAG